MSNKKISYDDILRNMGTYVVDGKLYIIQNAKNEQEEYEQAKLNGMRKQGQRGQVQGPQQNPPIEPSYAPIMQSNSNVSSNFRDKFIKPMQGAQGQQGQGQQGQDPKPIDKNQAIQNYLNMIKSKNHVKNVKSTKMNF